MLNGPIHIMSLVAQMVINLMHEHHWTIKFLINRTSASLKKLITDWCTFTVTWV